ncbi:DoxX family protein [Flavobacterium sp.]|jgi:putative oxidoreductase|uniref:DoxX family protein n=1 Tax=Flavobacterium sp. TaxID=239 RepID=UPI00338FC252
MFSFTVSNHIKSFIYPNPWSLSIGLLFVRFNCVLLLNHCLIKIVEYPNYYVKWLSPFSALSFLTCSFTIFTELVCTCFVFIGFLTRLALIPLIILMLITVFTIHDSETIGIRESSILYLLMYFVLIKTGPGLFSIDHLLKKRKKV